MPWRHHRYPSAQTWRLATTFQYAIWTEKNLLRLTLIEYQQKVRNASFEDLADFLVEYEFASVVSNEVISHFGLGFSLARM